MWSKVFTWLENDGKWGIIGAGVWLRGRLTGGKTRKKRLKRMDRKGRSSHHDNHMGTVASSHLRRTLRVAVVAVRRHDDVGVGCPQVAGVLAADGVVAAARLFGYRLTHPAAAGHHASKGWRLAHPRGDVVPACRKTSLDV